MSKRSRRQQTNSNHTDDDLHSQVQFCAESGQIWLHEHRMLLVHVDAQATAPCQERFTHDLSLPPPE